MIRCEPMTPTWLRVTASSPAEHALIGTLPGTQRSKGQWLVPADLGELLGYPPSTVPEVPGINPKLHPYQKEGVFKLLHQGSLLVAFEMRLGKSATFIEAMRLRYTRTDLGPRPIPALIVCPAIARFVWADQFAQWWPDHPRLAVIESSEDWKVATAVQGGQDGWHIIITSYELMMRNIKTMATIRWNAVAFDEVHRVKTRDAQVSQAAEQITANKPQALKAALSATPIDNEPPDLWHIMHVLRPGCLGSEYKFNERYSLFDTNEAGYRTQPKGLNPARAEELAARIRFFTARATKAEWGHLMPPLDVQIIRLKSERKTDWNAMFQKEISESVLDSFVSQAGNEKIEPAVELALEARKTRSHVLIASYFHETAHELTRRLEEEGETVIEITGMVTAGKRKPMLEAAAKLKSCCIVVSMKSVSEALEISFCNALIVAELSYVPKDIEQLTGRVHSMHSKTNVDIWILVLRGTLDEVIADRLYGKFSNINRLIGAGYSAAKITSALKERTPTKAELMKELLEAAKSRVDHYA